MLPAQGYRDWEEILADLTMKLQSSSLLRLALFNTKRPLYSGELLSFTCAAAVNRLCTSRA